MTKILLFPGQGSQKIGMGKEVFDFFPQLLEQADTLLGYSIKKLCLEDPGHELGQTQFTQPALFVVNALTYLKFLQDASPSQTNPDFVADHIVAGHSVGEYNALFAAGAFDWTTGIRLVAKRGEIMSHAKNGTMAAIMGATPDRIRNILDEAGLQTVDIANLNSPHQTVISGLKEDIAQAEQAFYRADMRHFIPLNVSGAFHSRYMQPVRQAFELFLDTIEFHDLKIPVISNVTAAPYEQGSLKKMLAEQITSPVRWSESMIYLLKMQVEMPEPIFFEMGPGTILTGLLRQIRKGLN